MYYHFVLLQFYCKRLTTFYRKRQKFFENCSAKIKNFIFWKSVWKKNADAYILVLTPSMTNCTYRLYRIPDDSIVFPSEKNILNLLSECASIYITTVADQEWKISGAPSLKGVSSFCRVNFFWNRKPQPKIEDNRTCAPLSTPTPFKKSWICLASVADPEDQRSDSPSPNPELNFMFSG